MMTASDSRVTITGNSRILSRRIHGEFVQNRAEQWVGKDTAECQRLPNPESLPRRDRSSSSNCRLEQSPRENGKASGTGSTAGTSASTRGSTAGGLPSAIVKGGQRARTQLRCRQTGLAQTCSSGRKNESLKLVAIAETNVGRCHRKVKVRVNAAKGQKNRLDTNLL